MRKTIIGCVLGLAAATTIGGTALADPPDCNWGELTAGSIAGGFDQGGHASDPSGDGRGPEDRVGLANVVERGNLHATCDAISGP